MAEDDVAAAQLAGSSNGTLSCTLDTLPAELLERITEMSDKTSQARLNQVSRKMHAITKPLLYRCVRLLDPATITQFVSAHEFASLPAKASALDHTVELHIAGASFKHAHKILACCGPNLISLRVVGVTGSDYDILRLPDALPPCNRLQELCLSGCFEPSVYLWAKKCKHLISLVILPPMLPWPQMWSQVDTASLPQELAHLHATGRESNEMNKFIKELLLSSKYHLRAIVLAGPDAWTAFPAGSQFLSLPELRHAMLESVPCHLLKSLLQDCQHLLKLSWTCKHQNCSIPVAQCDAHILERLPATLVSFATWGLTAAPTTVAAIKHAINRMRNLERLPSIKLRPDGQADQYDGPFPEEREQLLQDLRARGLRWTGKEEDEFLTWIAVTTEEDESTAGDEESTTEEEEQ